MLGTELVDQNEIVDNRNYNNLIADFNGRATYLEVAAITASNTRGNKVVRFQMKSKQHTTQISMTSELVEPLCYPLLFTKGEHGWGDCYRKIIKFPAYLASRMLMPEPGLTMRSLRNPDVEINVNRFQLLPRLSQTYLVDQVSRAIDYRLQWNKNNQEDIFCGQTQMRFNRDHHINEPVQEDDQSTFLPSSFHGSPNNALSIVSELGPADVFITLTCNPQWQEIQERLLPHQTAFDRPDVVCQV